MSKSASQADKHDVSEVKIEKFSYKWTVKNFKHLCMQSGEYIESPVFSFGSKNEIKWSISLYPNGYTRNCEGWLSVYLSWKHKDIVNGDFTISLINHKKFKYFEKIGKLQRKGPNNMGTGFPYFFRRDDVLNKGLGCLSDDSITICCDIVLPLDQISKPISEIKKLNKPKTKHSGTKIWFETLFLEKRLTDVQLVVTSCNKSLPAHKKVLASCSPVFEAMFARDTQEQNLDEVKIEDANYEVVREMLRFIYLGEVENTESMAIELLPLAKKYAIDELSKFCENVLIDQLAADNVLKIITIADDYNIQDLKSHAIFFTVTHMKGVVETDDFKSSTYVNAIKSIFKAIAY